MNQESIPQSEQSPFTSWISESAIAAANVANFCDKREHLENADPSLVSEAALGLRGLAMEIAEHEGLDIFDLYKNRLAEVERRTVSEGPDFSYDIQRAKTWHDLQVAQAAHNRHYHPDVAGLSKFEQVRHYSFHLAKLTGALVLRETDELPSEEFNKTRLPDFLIFGILLSTSVNERLEDIPLPRMTSK